MQDNLKGLSTGATVESSLYVSPSPNDTPLTGDMSMLDAYGLFVRRCLIPRLYSEKTIDTYWWAIKSFVDIMGNIPTKKLDYSTYCQWVAGMAGKGNKKITIHTNVSRFRVLVDYLNMQGLTDLDKDQIKLPKKPKSRARYARVDEIDLLVNAASGIRNKAIIEVMFSTGLRNAELRNLRINDINGSEVTIRGGKGDKDAVVFLNSRARGLLDKYWATRMDNLPWAFTSGTQNGGNGKIASSTLRYIFDSSCKLAGLNGISPKAVRHGYGTNLMLQNVHMRKIQEAMRHEYITTTQNYVHVDEQELKAEVLNVMDSQGRTPLSNPLRTAFA